jgi:hypothetical protein
VRPHLFAREFKHGLEQIELGIPDFKLSGMNANCDSARPGRKVIAGQCALATLVELSIAGQRERVRRDHQPFSQLVANVDQKVPS